MNSLVNTFFDTLNDSQKAAVLSQSSETLVIAGAGSGKTSVLTKRLVYLILQGNQPSSILCLTFTNKAAAEMRERVKTLLNTAGIQLPIISHWSPEYILYYPLLCTFHSLGVRLLREFGEVLGLKSGFSILDGDDQEKIMKLILKQNNLDPKNYPPRSILSFFGQCKQELLKPSRSRRLEREYPDLVHNLYKQYDAYLKQQNAVDFDDLIFLTYFLLQDFPEVRKTVQARWQHIMVDEFQDTNYAQFMVTQLLYDAQ